MSVPGVMGGWIKSAGSGDVRALRRDAVQTPI
jgi:hypothetical protein